MITTINLLLRNQEQLIRAVRSQGIEAQMRLRRLVRRYRKLWCSGDIDGDEMIQRATELVRREGRASTTLLQRRLRIGYARASRIIDALEEQGIVGPDMGGSRGRQVLN